MARLRTALIIVGLLAGLGVISRQMKITTFPIDMLIYLDGVRTFLDGGELYSQPMHAGDDLALPFIYPPFGALVMVPFVWIGNWFGNDVAGNAMILLSAGLLLVCLYYTARALLTEIPLEEQTEIVRAWLIAALVWPLVLLIEPVWLNASFAQINILLMCMVILDIVPRRRYLPQGWLIGLAAAIKISPLAMLLYFLMRRNITAIISAGVAGLLATGVAAAVRWEATREFFTVTLLGLGTKSQVGVNTAYQSNSSYKGMIMRWFSSEDALNAHFAISGTVWILLTMATMVCCALLMRALINRGWDTEAWLVNALLMLLISPISWSHHWVWLALALPIFAWRAYDQHDRIVLAITGIWALLVLTTPPKWWFGDSIDVWALPWWQKFLVSDFVWLAVALLAALGYLVVRTRRPVMTVQTG
ncbi:MAG: glycosyltransferase 87 family protein [Corynebacterium sp.]|nr:glycosyltransferase 87 family protein [Corynebacterium sp.]